jgi:hypothetical protein
LFGGEGVHSGSSGRGRRRDRLRDRKMRIQEYDSGCKKGDTERQHGESHRLVAGRDRRLNGFANEGSVSNEVWFLKGFLGSRG